MILCYMVYVDPEIMSFNNDFYLVALLVYARTFYGNRHYDDNRLVA